jgi:hypothetical protein
LSDLSVNNTGGGENSFGIFTTGLNLTARLQQVSVYAKGGATNVGVVNYTSSSPFISGVNLAVQGVGSQTNCGIYNLASSPTIIGVNALVWGGMVSYGIANFQNSLPVVIDGANIYAYSGTAVNIGVYNMDADNVKIRRSTISGTTDGLSNVGGSVNTRVSQSTIINGVAGGGYTCVASDDDLGHQLSIATCL